MRCRTIQAVAGALVATLLSATALSQAPAVEPEERPPHERPDVILVTIDALRADHLSGYGYERLTSPALDAFAARNVVFTRAISQAPYTKAAVASLMTGLYPSSHKAVTATVPFPETMTGHPSTHPIETDVLSSNVITLAETLRAAGYETAGYTANPFLIDTFGFGQGFDTFEFFPGTDFVGARQVVDRVLDHVERTSGRPLFLWVHLMEPHSPYAAPEWARGMFPLRGRAAAIPRGVAIPSWLLPGSPRDLRLYEVAYDEEIAAADAAVDVLLRGIDAARDLDRSLVIVTADHGEEFLDHGGWEHGSTLFDELVHVPLVVHAPGAKPAAIAAQVQLVDLFPTIADFAGAETPEGLAGRSLKAIIEGGRPTSELAFSEIAGSQYAVRTDDWKLIASARGGEQLFDLRADAFEHHDVSAANRTRAETLRRVADRYLGTAIGRGERIAAARVPIDPQVRDRLRALGYAAR